MICPNCGHDNLPGSEECAACLQDLTHLDRARPYDRVERSLIDDPVSVLEPVPPVSVRPSATLQTVIQTMARHNVGAVVVVNDAGEPIGIFSERDLLLRVVGVHEHFPQLPVSLFMTRKPEAVEATAKLAYALHLMDGGDYRHLPVLADGRLAGMISARDMLRYLSHLCRDLPNGTGHRG